MNNKLAKDETLIMGCHCVGAVLKHCPERIKKVYVQDSSGKIKERKDHLLNEIANQKISLSSLSKKNLDTLCQSQSHQGIAALISKKKETNLNQFLHENEDRLVVALDSIYDPHNLGAILRVCECFGVGLVLWSKNRGASITPVVTKTSSSASEFVPQCVVSNLATTLDKFAKAGYDLVGAQLSDNSESLFNYKFSRKTVLILGSEGEGMRPLIQKKLTSSVVIPMEGIVDSLNVAQAAAVCISFWKAQV